MKDQILSLPNKKLRQKSLKVTTIDEDVKRTIDLMVKASLDWEADHPHELSAALAAPQVGQQKRIIIIRNDLDNKDDLTFVALINPKIIKFEGDIEKDHEGCLSVPGVYGLVPRHNKIRIEALNSEGELVKSKVSGSLARTIQHEIDHLDGILFIDHIKDEKDAFFKLDDDGELIPLDYEKDIKSNNILWD